LIDPLLLAAIIPIKSYSNAEADKKKRLSDNKNKSGIYMWKNIINKKQYIGSANDLSKRLSFYYSNQSMESLLKRSQTHICSALLKHGSSNFSLEIIEFCEPEKCIEREKYYINFFKSEYNIIKDPTLPPMSGRNHSEDTKQIMSDTAKKIDNSGRFKTGQPRIEGAGRPSQQIEVTDIKNNTTISYNSMSAAAIALNINIRRIS